MPQIRCAHDDEKYVIYLPTNIELDVSPLGLSRENSSPRIIDLQNKEEYQAVWKQDGKQLQLTPCYEDMLIILRKSNSGRACIGKIH